MSQDVTEELFSAKQPAPEVRMFQIKEEEMTSPRDEGRLTFSDPESNTFSIEEQDDEDSDEELTRGTPEDSVPHTPMKRNNSMPDITALPSHMPKYRKSSDSDHSEQEDDLFTPLIEMKEAKIKTKKMALTEEL